MKYELLSGDALEQLKTIPDGTVNTCVTSPPYYGLRDYGVDGQIGLEETPEQYIDKLVDVFREVKRALRDDGTLWVNIGDSYNGSGKAGKDPEYQIKHTEFGKPSTHKERFGFPTNIKGLKPKDLIGIPWMLAFALRADGWYLRQDIIWAKPNPMPESVTDRCTKSHEYIFLLSKSQRYYYNADAIAEPIAESTMNDARMNQDDYETCRPERGFTGRAQHGSGLLKPKPPRYGGNKYTAEPDIFNRTKSGNVYDARPFRNKRSVWSVTTKPFKGSHFAVFPPDLIEPCILAGAPFGGLVLDPFTGSGTTGVVALSNGRNFIGSELNPKYVKMAEQRIKREGVYQERIAIGE